ncbi:hypothetical protein ACFWQK_13965 [Brachybacterium paraconglomeratum]
MTAVTMLVVAMFVVLTLVVVFTLFVVLVLAVMIPVVDVALMMGTHASTVYP